MRTRSSPRRTPRRPRFIINLPTATKRWSAEQGSALSAGQAQRVALARALYRDPFLVVLMSPIPTSTPRADEALTRAILGLRARGAIVVVVRIARARSPASTIFIWARAASSSSGEGGNHHPPDAAKSAAAAESGGTGRRRMSGAEKRNAGVRCHGDRSDRQGRRRGEAGLHWAFGDAGSTDSANESIRRHIIAGQYPRGILAFGLGGLGLDAEISGALIAPGDVVVDSNIKRCNTPPRRGRQIVRPRRRPREGGANLISSMRR